MLFSAVLNVCSCALSFLWSSNKKCGLNPALPKTCGLKSANISVNKRGETSTFCTTHLHWPADLPLQFALTISSGCRSTLSNLAKISPFFKILLFRRTQIHFFCWPKIPVFQRPRTRRILELQTCKQVFCDLLIP